MPSQGKSGKPTTRRYSDQEKAQAVRLVRQLRKELGTDARAIATGGLAELIYPHASTIERVDPFLTLEGLRLVWERNH